MFTFLSVIRQNFEYNLRIFAYFRVKTQKSTDFAHTFKKKYIFFLDFSIKIILFTLKIYFFTTKDEQSFVKISFFSNIFTFLSVIRQNFEYNLRILANFRIKAQKSTDFTYTFSKNYSFFFGFFNKGYIYYTKNLFFFKKRCRKYRKNQVFSNMFIFLSVIRQNFEYNLRIFPNFSVNT